jgi:hypothetical protein
MLERSFLPQARIFLVLLRACTATRPTDSFAVCSRGGVAKYRSRRGSATSSAPQWKHGVSCPRAGVTCTCMACDDEPATIAARPPRMGAVAVSFAPPAIRCGDPRPVRPARYQRRQDICVRGDSLSRAVFGVMRSDTQEGIHKVAVVLSRRDSWDIPRRSRRVRSRTPLEG